MSVDTYDPILGIILQGTGNNNNSWGITFNNSATTPIVRAIAGVNVIGSTGGTVDLSTVVPPLGLRQDIDAVQLLNGVLTAALTIKVPITSKIWWFENDTTGAFNAYVQAGSVIVQIPQGIGTMIMSDGLGNLRRLDRARVGEFVHYAGASAPAGMLSCNGASVLRTDYPDLFAAIGTTWGSVDSLHFTLPNLVDTNRFLRAADGVNIHVGTYQSNQNQSHTHAFSGALSAGTLTTDTQGLHSHGLNLVDPSHVHGITQAAIFNAPAGAASSECFANAFNGATNLAVTGISGSIVNAGAHSHNITGSPGLGTFSNVNQGGTEARPENAAALICIKY
jgi:microcystin-dependent protein